VVYSLEQDTFIIKSYYRNGVINEDGQWIHSVQACKDEYLATYLSVDIEGQFLMAPIRRIVDRFGATGNVSKRKSPGRPQFREEET
jgi:hypothetical protein